MNAKADVAFVSKCCYNQTIYRNVVFRTDN